MYLTILPLDGILLQVDLLPGVGAYPLSLSAFTFAPPAEEGPQLVVDGIDEEEDQIKAHAESARKDRHPLKNRICPLVRGDPAHPNRNAKGQR
jgi:hypothetical protein